MNIHIPNWIANWQFEPISSFVTLIIVPVVVYIFALIKRPLFAGIKYVTLGVIYNVSATLSKVAAASLSLRRYARIQLAGSSKYLSVPALRDVNLEIDKIFVPLTLERAGTQTRYDHTNFLQAGNRVLVIGDPGSGKSSIARRVFRDECLRAQNSPRKSRFPLLIELRHVPFPARLGNTQLGDWLIDHIKAKVNENEAYNIGVCFDTYMRTNGILLILDGLDEISTRHYDRAFTAITQCAQRLEHLSEYNVVLITMRIQFYDQIRHSLAQIFPIMFSLNRFSPTDIYEFLWKWDFLPEDKVREVTRIYTDLTDRPTLREMCSNPLILSMYVAQDQASRHSILPESRTEFYSRVIEELIIRRRAAQMGNVEGQAVIKEQRQKIFGKIAYEHLSDADQAANLLSWAHGTTIVSEVTSLRGSEAEKYLTQLAIDTGLLAIEREGEAFRFIHLTFCEFFAAFEAVQGRPEGWGELQRRHRQFQENVSLRTRLAEVLPFACALMPRHMKAQAIFDIAALVDNRLLALAFLETKLYDHEVWPSFRKAAEADLITANPAEHDPDWLRKVHLFMVVCTDADRASAATPNIEPIQLAGFFDQLGRRADGIIYRLVDSYAEQDAAAAFRVAALCHIDMMRELPHVVIKNCDQPPFLTLLLEQASREPERITEWSCALAEAGLRSSAAANALTRSNVSLWTTRANEVAKRCRWHNSLVAQRSPYLECLSVACGADEKNWNFPLVEAIRRIKAPRDLVVWRIMVSILFAFATISVIVGTSVLLTGEPRLTNDLKWWKASTLAGLVVGFVITETIMLYMQFTIIKRRLVFSWLISVEKEKDLGSRNKNFIIRWLSPPVGLRLPTSGLGRFLWGHRRIQEIERYIMIRDNLFIDPTLRY